MLVNNLQSSSNNNEMPTITFRKQNWFQLRKNQQDNSRLNYDTFIKELETQIKNNLLRDLKQFVIADLKVVISEAKYNTVNAMNSEYLPTLSYHATTSTKNVNSIVNHGYLLPTETHPTSNQKIKMAHGNFYGTGIYSFLNKDFALWMAANHSDDNRDLQIIVNLVDMRQPSIMNEEDFKNKDKKIKQNKENVTHVNGNTLPYYLTPDIEGNYSLSINDISKVASTLVFNNNMLVTGSAKNIIPVCVVTISKIRNPEKIHKFTLTDKATKEFKKLENINSENKITAIRICDDIYIFYPNYQKDTSKIITSLPPIPALTPIHYHFVIADYFLTIENKNTLKYYIDTKPKSNTNIYTFGTSGLNSTSFNSIKLRGVGNSQNNILTTLQRTLDKITTSHNGINIMYLFSDNLQDFNLQDLVNKYAKILKFNRIVVKVITVDNNPNNTNIAIQIKYHLQTETIFDNAIYSLEDNDLNTILTFIEEENLEISPSIDDYSCDNNKMYGSGFLINLHQQPVTTHRSVFPIYKGFHLKYVMINEIRHLVQYVSNINNQNITIYLEAYNQLLNILCSYRNYILVNPKLVKYYSSMFDKICTSIQTNLKVISEYVREEKNLNDKVNLIKRVKGTYYKLGRIISDISAFTKTDISGKWYSKLLNMKFGKKILKRTSKHTKYLLKVPNELCEQTSTGFGIRCVRSNACEIEPWLINISYVSNDTFELGKVFVQNELCQDIIDSSSNIVTDVLLLDNKISNEIKMYYSYIFTRNIYTYLPSQPIALITNTWIFLLESFFRSTNLRSVELTVQSLEIYQKLFDRVWDMFLVVKNFYAQVNTDIELEYFNKFITTGLNELVTFNQIVGLLLRNDINVLTDDNFIKCFVECINKSSKSFIKQNKIPVIKLIQELFGLDTNSDLLNYSFDMDKAVKITGKFYKSINLSCTPFSFVAMWEFFKINNNNKKDVFDKFITKEVSMRNCLKYFVFADDQINGSIAQVALYLHSLKCCQDKQYKISSSAIKMNCNKIIDDFKNECIQNIIARQSLLKHQNNRRTRRYNERLDKGQKYVIYHKMPTIFTHKQVAEMNVNRPQNDQLELMPSGLLKHHCCYPDCPKYLCNFKTAKDKEKGKRYGLMNHFKYDAYFNNYFPMFHIMAKQFAPQSLNHEIFYNKMFDHYKKTRYATACQSVIFVDMCKIIYNSYKQA